MWENIRLHRASRKNPRSSGNDFENRGSCAKKACLVQTRKRAWCSTMYSSYCIFNNFLMYFAESDLSRHQVGLTVHIPGWSTAIRWRRGAGDASGAVVSAIVAVGVFIVVAIGQDAFASVGVVISRHSAAQSPRGSVPPLGVPPTPRTGTPRTATAQLRLATWPWLPNLRLQLQPPRSKFVESELLLSCCSEFIVFWGCFFPPMATYRKLPTCASRGTPGLQTQNLSENAAEVQDDKGRCPMESALRR